MSEPQTVMVLQLAKELGMPPLALVDKLKALNINVKSHMSELTEEQAQMARTSLNPPSTPAAKGAKKSATPKAVKKKAASPSSTAATSASPQPETSTAERHAASPIIRRRTKADGLTETVTQQLTPSTPATRQGHAGYYSGAEHTSEHGEGASAEGWHSDMPMEELEATEESSAYASSFEKAEADEETTELSSVTTSESEMISEEGATFPAIEAAPPAAEGQKVRDTQATRTTTTERVASSSEVTARISKTTEGQDTSVSATSAGAPSSPAIRPGAPARPPIAPFSRPVAPRRSILKIVEPIVIPPKPAARPTPSGAPGRVTPRVPGAPGTAHPGHGAKDEFRILKVTKENLDQMAEEEAAKKRGPGKELEIRPEDVRFADYRKKEMVFLPRKKKIPVGKEIKRTQLTQAKAQKRVVEMHDTISVQDLANQLSVKATEVIKKLIGMGQMVTINQSLDFDTATLVASEFQYEVRNIAFKEEDLLSASDETDLPEQLEPRPPVVTIMGHVDHGKTTLLDAIREANVAAGEAGGITQHIGAYTVEKNGKLITFVDTPGHEAFTMMRARGANITDIVILVVSADDGVMPQTREALSHAQAAKVPIIVAVNKIDKPGANPEKIKQGLAELNLLAEDWGGDTMFVPVSALKKTNIDKLLDSILLQAEVLDLKANPSVLAHGTVLEARLEKGRGPVVSVLVNRGTLKVGDPIVSGPYAGKVRALNDDKGRAVKSVGPGIATEILGFEGVPNAGESFHVTSTDADARKIAENRSEKTRTQLAAPTPKASLDALFAKIQAGESKQLDVILKADVFGSVEAIKESLTKLSTEKVKVNVIHCSPGGITESDVLLASASNAIIIGFNVRPETKARQLAEGEHVDIKCYNIIYELLDDVKKAMTGLLDKKKVEKFLGRAEVRQTFHVPKVGTVAGTSVIDGKIIRGANVRLLRDSRVIFDGKMSSLKRFKDDAKEVATGYECGIGIENFNDLKPGDIIEAYQIELVAPELNA